jgi:hypothetical protein
MRVFAVFSYIYWEYIDGRVYFGSILTSSPYLFVILTYFHFRRLKQQHKRPKAANRYSQLESQVTVV